MDFSIGCASLIYIPVLGIAILYSVWVENTLLPEVPSISHSPLASSNLTSAEWLVLTSQINSTSPGAPTGWVLRILSSSLDQGNVSLLIPRSTTHCLALSKTTGFFLGGGGGVSPILLNTTLTALFFNPFAQLFLNLGTLLFVLQCLSNCAVSPKLNEASHCLLHIPSSLHFLLFFAAMFHPLNQR